MNVEEKGALSQSLAIYDQMTGGRRANARDPGASAKYRSRAAARLARPPSARLADIAGLLLAFIVAELLVGPGRAPEPVDEIIAFLLTLPAWVVVAKLYGLYDRDEERTDHSTADDLVGRLPPGHGRHLGLLRRCLVTGLADPDLLSSSSSGFSRSAWSRSAARWRARLPAPDHVRAEHDHRRRRRRRPARRAGSSSSIPSTGSTSSASSTRARRSSARTSRT